MNNPGRCPLFICMCWAQAGKCKVNQKSCFIDCLEETTEWMQLNEVKNIYIFYTKGNYFDQLSYLCICSQVIKVTKSISY